MAGLGPLLNDEKRVMRSHTNLTIDEKRRPAALNLTPIRTGSSGSSSSENSLKPPRTPRFAEATSVHSPIDGRSPFADPEKSHVAQAQPGDIGFGYINNRESVAVPMTPKTPLKSALKVPGTPARFNNPLSPTFREEDVLEKREQSTDKEQARDVVCFITAQKSIHKTDKSIENQGSSSHGQVCSAWRQLQLLSNHSFHDLNIIHYFQCNQGSARSKQDALLGQQHQHLASEARPRYGLRVSRCLPYCLCCVLPRWSPSC
jgi:hypothetical protein